MSHTAHHFFELLGLPQQFSIDLEVLQRNYRKIQAEVHPDKFVTATPSERLQSMQTATLMNEAYQTLKHPTSRARYLLHLQGIETLEDSNTAMPADFLMTQMEWREAMEDAQHAHDIDALEDLLRTMKASAKALQEEFADTVSGDPQAAAQLVRKLSFIDKVSADVQEIISRLED
ncbi:Fe-S protein assembly co-chaperone HscB [Methylotenera sp. 1P/1]|uniref:Fe-S protein assembly co-chaperone HscB n=1 Tax=Methylotenera sp. 1P/1 TaxID=1131551 RepID=UPI000361414B|nr:Fe-S protein assembly co-chaperone HscB [Methylotenera sp. 1P/1]